MKFYTKMLPRKMFAGLVLFSLLSLPVSAQMAVPEAASGKNSLTKTEIELTNNIKIDSIKKFTSALASDDMEGRGTLQPGGDKAANWIADRFKNLGLKPLGDNGSYLQAVEFKEVAFAPGTMFQVGEETFKNGKDYGFVPLPFKKTDTDIEAEMVYAGYGTQLSDPATAADNLSKLNGKIVVTVNGPPEGMSQEAWEKSGANAMIFQMLLVSGAKGLIVLGNGREDDQTQTYIDYFGRRQIEMTDGGDGNLMFAQLSVPPMMMVSKETGEKLFSGSGISYADALKKADDKDFTLFDLKQTAKIAAKYNSKTGTSSNVAGFIEGSDPKLKKEAVLFSAHYDAYGIMNGEIYNGAADNALGTSEMLAVAEAYSKMNPKPKRSMIFIAVTGEEYGLYGSKYWAKNPTWDVTKVAANLNLDGIGTEIYGPVKQMVGFGAEHSTLGSMLDDVAKSYGIRIIPDPQPEEKVFYRSDHYSFVERGVPALMLMGAPEGTKEELITKVKAWEAVHYHQPSDDVMENWDWSGAKTVADIMGILGLRISNQEKMPEWLKTSRFADLKRGNTDELPKEN